MIRRLRDVRRLSEQRKDSDTSPPVRQEPSLAQDVVIALTRPESGKIVGNVGPSVSAAILVELVRERRLFVSGTGRRARVIVHDRSPLGDDILDGALSTIPGTLGTKVSVLMGLVPDSSEVVETLVRAGLLEVESRRRMGYFTVLRHLPTPAAGRDELVERVRSALLGESSPDDRLASLIAILHLATPMRLLVPKQRVKEATRRAAEIREGVGVDQRAILSAVAHAMNSSGWSGGDTSGAGSSGGDGSCD